MQRPWLILVLLMAGCVSLAIRLDQWFQQWEGNRAESANVLALMMGDGRRIFATHFVTKADAYFHSGQYPSIFDRKPGDTLHIAGDAGLADEDDDHDAFFDIGKPRDWIDRFSRHFYPTQHTHLGGGELGDSGEVREILPWLRLAAELDPGRSETYTVTSYWLRKRMGKVDEAREFLREGLRRNPGDYAILFELGRIYEENLDDAGRARNVWELALRNWRKEEANKPEPDLFLYSQIVGYLARLEENQNNLERSLHYLSLLREVSPNPDAIQSWMDDLKNQLTAQRADR